MNVSAVTFEMTGDEIPMSDTVVLNVSRVALLSVNLDMSKHRQHGGPMRQFIITNHETYLGQNQLRISGTRKK